MKRNFVDAVRFNPNEVKWMVIKAEKVLNEKKVKYDHNELTNTIIQNVIEEINTFLNENDEKIIRKITKNMLEGR
jgi:DNA-directed RNA polymerase beta' subunit